MCIQVIYTNYWLFYIKCNNVIYMRIRKGEGPKQKDENNCLKGERERN